MPTAESRTLTGTVTYEGDYLFTLKVSREYGCMGGAIEQFDEGHSPLEAIREGAPLMFYELHTGELLGATELGDSKWSYDGDSCSYSYSVTLPARSGYQVVVANLYDWTIYDLPAVGSPLDLTVRATDLAHLLPTPGPTEDPVAEEIAYYQENLADDVRTAIGIHIRGVERTEVNRDRIFISVESRYGTASVLKELMYELYDDIASDVDDDIWKPDIVTRMGSDYTNGWLQSTTNVADWWDIDDQLEWERATEFTRKGRLCC
jgi:hypothetical protein